MKTGWVKLHRSLLDWEWYDDVNARILLIHLLISVNYEDKKWKGIEVKKGSMVLSWSSLSAKCGLSVKKCRTAMDKLERAGEVARQTASKYQVVTLLKWDKLQQSEDLEGKQEGKETDKQRASKGQAKGKQRATTKEYNNNKNLRNKEIKKTKLSEISISDLEDDEIYYFKIAKAFQELFIKNAIEKEAPTKNQKNANFKNYVNPIRLMFEKDEVTEKQIKIVFDYLGSVEGDFWKTNILSTSKLRQKFPQLIMKANQNNTQNGNRTQNHTPSDAELKRQASDAYDKFVSGK